MSLGNPGAVFRNISLGNPGSGLSYLRNIAARERARQNGGAVQFANPSDRNTFEIFNPGYPLEDAVDGADYIWSGPPQGIRMTNPAGEWWGPCDIELPHTGCPAGYIMNHYRYKYYNLFGQYVSTKTYKHAIMVDGCGLIKFDFKSKGATPKIVPGFPTRSHCIGCGAGRVGGPTKCIAQWGCPSSTFGMVGGKGVPGPSAAAKAISKAAKGITSTSMLGFNHVPAEWHGHSPGCRTYCIDCQKGRYAQNFVGPNSKCIVCPEGWHAKEPRSESCERCPIGYHQDWQAMDSCKICTSGKFADVLGLALCKTCGAGKYDSGSGDPSPCLDCAAGKWSTTVAATTSSTCKDCAAGKWSTTVAAPVPSTCIDCTDGKYSTTVGANTPSTCIDCAAGKYSGTKGADTPTTCIDCAAGKYSEVSGMGIICLAYEFEPVGFYDVNTGKGCYFFSWPFDHNCKRRWKTVCARFGFGCKSCIAGKYSTTVGADTPTTCIDCVAGKFSTKTAAPSPSTCIDCVAGRYQTQTGKTSCIRCLVGKYSTTVAASAPSTCIDCVGGKYSTTTGANTPATCIDCIAGRYQHKTGKISCISCRAGKYSVTVAADDESLCIHCAAGKFSIVWAANTPATCIDCFVGRYQTRTAKTSCTECAWGKYSKTVAATTSSTCKTCPGGYYNPEKGASKCDACAAGKSDSITYYNKAIQAPGSYWVRNQIGTDMTSPSMALVGKMEKTSCAQCPRGFYSTSAGVTECTACAAGKYSEVGPSDRRIVSYISYGQCVAMIIGRTENGGVIRSTSCSTPSTSSDDCTSCSAGTFSETVGASVASICKDCAAGTYSETVGATVASVCKDCAAGKYSIAGSRQVTESVCKSCVGGKYSISGEQQTDPNVCIDCAAGLYSISGEQQTTESVCIDCVAGRYSETVGATTSSVCKLCEAGYYSNDVAATSPCTFCETGYHQALRGQASCNACLSGRYQGSYGKGFPERGIDGCQICPGGYYSELEAQTSCIGCTMGRFATIVTLGSSSDVCADCPAGYHQERTERDECNICDAGKYSTTVAASSASTCIECERGKYSSTSGSTSCTECESGKRSNNAWYAPTCHLSPPIRCRLSGKWLGASDCESCPTGRFGDAGSFLINRRGSQLSGWELSHPNSEPCKECPEGKYLDGAQCTDCAPGYYSDDKAQLTCRSCGIGRYQSSSGQQSCLKCTYGKYFDEQGATECKDCYLGQYSNTKGHYECSGCSRGTYGDEHGIGQQFIQVRDAMGRPTLEEPTCKKCIAGLFLDYTSASNSSECKTCAVGTFSSSLGSHSCTNCIAGKFTDQEGQTACSNCIAGKYSEQSGQTSCMNCVTGQYSTKVGADDASTCVQCPEGQYGSQDGLSSCTHCTPGKWAAPGLSSCTTIPTPFVPNNRAELKAAVDACVVLNPNGSQCGFKPPISQWNTGKIIDMSSLFDVYLSAFERKKCQIRRDFKCLEKDRFNQDISSWNTASVTNMEKMFRGAIQFNQPLNSWNVANVKTMKGMFSGASSFNKNIASWDVSAVTDMSHMFESIEDDAEQNNLYVASDAANIRSTYASGFTFNQNIGSWDVSSVSTMAYMFKGSYSFDQYIGSWTTSSVTDMSSMFQSAISFNQDITGWNTAKVTDMSSMFRFAVTFNQDVSAWNTVAVTMFNYMFRNALNFGSTDSVKQLWTGAQSNSIFFQTPGWSSYVPAAPGTEFSPNTKEELICAIIACVPLDDSGGYGTLFSQQYDCTQYHTNSGNSGNSGNTGNSGNSGGYGYGYGYGNRRRRRLKAYGVGPCPGTHGNMADWDVSKITDMDHLFAGRSPDPADPSRSISNWDVSAVTSMEKMFLGANWFNTDISGWNTGSVTNMIFMFGMANDFNQDLSGWDVSKVTDMTEMFIGADSYNPSGSSGRRLQQKTVWDTSSVTSMKNMFADLPAFNDDISGWDTSKVTNMASMFENCISFNRSLHDWNVSRVMDMTSMFEGASSYDQKPLRGSWSPKYFSVSNTDIFSGVIRGSVGHSTCQVGQGVLTTGTVSTNTVCEPCPVGKFSASDSMDICQDHSTCPVGQGVLTSATVSANSVCEPCPVGKFSASDSMDVCQDHSTCPVGQGVLTSATVSANSVCEPCTAARFSSTNDTTPCQNHKKCQPGQGVVTEGTTSANSVCESCPTGKFSDKENYDQCVSHWPCSQGRGLISPGTASSNSVCEACPSGKFLDTDDMSVCQNHNTCPPGKGAATAGTESTDTVCESCTAGKFSDSGDMSVCQDHIACPVGEGVLTAGTASSDNVCQTCPFGKFSDMSDLNTCQDYTSCPVGQGLMTAGTSSTDIVCQTCPSGKFSDMNDLNTCQDYTPCPVGQGLMTTGTASTDTICQTCLSGKFSDVNDLGACQDHAPCPVDQGLVTSGTASADTGCQTCQTGKFSDRSGQYQCESVTTCTLSQYQVLPPTSSNDRECASLTICTASQYDTKGVADDGTATENRNCVDHFFCPEGQGFVTAGTATSNTVCESCPDGKFSDVEDMSTCQNHSTCPAGTGVVHFGIADFDTTCEPCSSGRFSPNDELDFCEDHETCLVRINKPGNAITDNVCLSASIEIEAKVETMLEEVKASGFTSHTVSKSQVDDATEFIIESMKTDLEAGNINIGSIDLSRVRKFNDALINLEGAKNARFQKAKIQQKKLASEAVSLFSARSQSSNPAEKQEWRRDFARMMKYQMDSNDIDSKLTSVCENGCASTVAAPSVTQPDCSSYDNEHCCSYDIREDFPDRPTLLQAFDVGSFSILCDDTTIISKQVWVSENSYTMECWNSATSTFGNTQANMAAGNKYTCNGYEVWIGSQSVSNQCGSCDVNAFCDRTDSATTCTCNAPFTGNGTYCDANQCTSHVPTDVHNCHGDATCSNTDTGFTCACNAGFLGDGVNCEADQCLTNNGGCDADATCVDTFGADPVCTCKAGFVDWSPQDQTGMSCDPDQCQTANRCETEANGGHCIDEEDGHRCDCRGGFYRLIAIYDSNTPANESDHFCVNIDECDHNVTDIDGIVLNDCDDNAVCQDFTPSANNIWEQYTCTCTPPYSGNGTHCTPFTPNTKKELICAIVTCIDLDNGLGGGGYGGSIAGDYDCSQNNGGGGYGSTTTSCETTYGKMTDWDVRKIEDMSELFSGRTATADISNWDVSAVTDMSLMFLGSLSFNQDISSWNTGNVKDMSFMFGMAETFNQDLNRWDVSSVTNMENMFVGADSYNPSGSSGRRLQQTPVWDTSSVTSMKGMFADLPAFNGDISGWNTSKVNDMSEMFKGALAFNRDISTWNVASVTTMQSMFENADLFNQFLSGWDVSQVTNMDNMFKGASAYDQDPFDSTPWTTSTASQTDMFKNVVRGSIATVKTYNQIEKKAETIIAQMETGTVTETITKAEVEQATVSLIQDIKTKKDAGTTVTAVIKTAAEAAAAIDLSVVRKFTKAIVSVEVKQEEETAPTVTVVEKVKREKKKRYKKIKQQEKALAVQVVTLFAAESQSTDIAVKKEWKRNFAVAMKFEVEPENLDEKLANACANGCSSAVAAPSAPVPDCSSYDNENCCSYDIANDANGKPTLVQPFDVGSFAIMCDGSTIISKQHWTSEGDEYKYAMECWDDTAKEFANTQGNMVVGDEYKCNGYIVWVGSQGVTNGCDTCDDNASCDSSTDPVTCTCNAPYTGNGTHCDADQCTSLVPTDVHNCHGDATCNNTDTGFTCACNAGFLGDGVNCEADQCLTNNGGCDADATCVDTFGADPVCTCKAGFVDWSPQGQTGMSCDPDQCQVANACATEANGGICADVEDGYTCSCRPTVFVANTLAVGTTDIPPAHACVNVDECDSASPSHNCGTNYECQDLTPTASETWRGFLCNCPTGYYVTIQSQQTVCIDVNECNLSESDSRHHGCPERSTCTNYVVNDHGMTHSCTCESGYDMVTQGGADTCVDINECQNSPCSNGETCTNFDGGYICSSGSVNSANDTFCEDNNINSGNTPKSTCDGWLEDYNDLYCCGEGLACQIFEKKYNCGECCTK